MILFLFLTENVQDSQPIMIPPPSQPPATFSEKLNDVEKEKFEILWKESRKEIWRQDFHKR